MSPSSPADRGRNSMEAFQARQALGLEHLVLQIHDASFPGDADEDLGRGSPYSRGAERLYALAAELGFDAIQLGPQGLTGRGNASPYDGTIFSRNPLNLPLGRMVDEGRLRKDTLQRLQASLAAAGEPPSYSQIYDAVQQATAEIVAAASRADRAAAREFLGANLAWLLPDALYPLLCREHGSGSWRDWAHSPKAALDRQLFAPPPGEERAAADRLARLRAVYERPIEDYALVQWLLHREHQALRARLAELGLALYADLQVGLSLQDTWTYQGLFRPGYLMGAPPSRTNPEGQPWGYAILNPELLGTLAEPGPALRFVQARVAKTLTECDGVRIDHPHGWVDPWVYRDGQPDPFQAVQHGARLFSSPAREEHPELAAYAIARPEQLDDSQPAYADGYVRSLDDEQVARYARLIDVIGQEQAARGQSRVIACEVLSTLPYQVRRVMERHGLGRFRVTQKLSLTDPADVYRIEQAEPGDWIMMSTHDTATIWQLARGWVESDKGRAWGEYLAGLLGEPEAAASIAQDAGALVHALFRAMLQSRARNVVVFFADLLGLEARYNEPGVVSERNWSLRAPAEMAEVYASRCASGQALDVRACLARAAARRK